MKKAMFLPIVVAALMLGCESAKQSTPNAEGEKGLFHQATTHQLSTREYRVDPPDEIVIKAPKIAELDGVRQKVRPDGKISLNMVGEVYVVGMTPSEIGALLKKLVTKFYEEPEIKVEVIANSKFYYVFGQGVARQGRYPYTGQDTVITALAEAGLGEAAWPQQVRVSRPAKENGAAERATAVVDFKRIFQTGDLAQNYLLEEGDIIEIPPGPLAAWDMKTRRILGPLTGTAGAVSAGQQVAQPGGRTTQ
jgi:polysaccharide export outer membrane protein